MTIVIKKEDSKAVIEKKLARLELESKKKKSTGFNAKKFLGKIKNLYGNPLTYQKNLRH